MGLELRASAAMDWPSAARGVPPPDPLQARVGRQPGPPAPHRGQVRAPREYAGPAPGIAVLTVLYFPCLGPAWPRTVGSGAFLFLRISVAAVHCAAIAPSRTACTRAKPIRISQGSTTKRASPARKRARSPPRGLVGPRADNLRTAGQL